MKCVIYYFSGTGNNLAIAKRLADKLGNTMVFPIANLEKQKEIPIEYDWVGYIVPCYNSHVSPFVLECMQEVIYTREQKIFLITGCAGNRGVAIQDMRHKVNECEKAVSLEYMIILPGNHILSYGAFPKWYNDFLRKISYWKIRRIAKDVLSNKSMKPLRAGVFYKGKNEEKNQKKLCEYPTLGTRYMVDSNCKKCGICVKICPVENITMEHGHIVFHEHCAHCMACIQWCPAQAIDCDMRAKNRKRYHHADVKIQDMTIR